MGNNLQITLIDGRVVVLEDFFGPEGENARLFISADGYLNEVELVQGADGAVFATYGPTEQWGKWSPSDDLIFLEGTEVAHVAPASDDDVSMLGTGLLGGLGGAGLLGVGAVAAKAVAMAAATVVAMAAVTVVAMAAATVVAMAASAAVMAAAAPGSSRRWTRTA